MIAGERERRSYLRETHADVSGIAEPANIALTNLLEACSARLRGHRQITHTEVGVLAGLLTISFERSCFRRIAYY